MAGKEAAGVYGLIVSLTNMAYLFPRALSNYYSPSLAKATMVRCKTAKDIMSTFSRNNAFLLFFIACLLLMLWPIWEIYYLNVEKELYFKLFFTAVACSVVGQLNLPSSRWLIVKEKSEASLVINLAAFLFFSFGTYLLLLAPAIDGLEGFLMVLFFLFIVYLVRNLVQVYVVKKDMKDFAMMDRVAVNECRKTT